MPRVVVPLRMDERAALVELAQSELRDPQDQARFILRRELKRRGLLSSAPANAAQAAPTAPQAPCHDCGK